MSGVRLARAYLPQQKMQDGVVTIEVLEGKLEKVQIDADVYGRAKKPYSIWRKLQRKSVGFSSLSDIYGFRVIVKDVATCYLALGALHERFKPVPGKFKDYIAIPKNNGYQSLHTTLIGPYGTPVEVQIRTREMHHIAETGVASHWLYKEDEKTLSELQHKTHSWLQSLLELQSATGDSSEFLEHVKVDLFPDEVYVFTPKGKILALPRGATVIDFAYAVHTDIGHRCVAARIDHELIPLSAALANGNQVEIITAPHANPNPAWLSFVKTSRARTKIRQYLRALQQDGSSALGESMLNQELRALGVVPAEIPGSVWEQAIRETDKKSRRDLYADIGLGHILAAVFAQRLVAHDEVHQAAGADNAGGAPLVIRGSEGVAVQFATCCRPIPGDPIVGHLRKDQGLRIHTENCRAASRSRSTEPQNWIRVEWAPDPGQLFDVRIKVVAKNMRGVLGRVATGIAHCPCNVTRPTGGQPTADARRTGVAATMAPSPPTRWHPKLRGDTLLCPGQGGRSACQPTPPCGACRPMPARRQGLA